MPVRRTACRIPLLSKSANVSEFDSFRVCGGVSASMAVIHSLGNLDLEGSRGAELRRETRLWDGSRRRWLPRNGTRIEAEMTSGTGKITFWGENTRFLASRSIAIRMQCLYRSSLRLRRFSTWPVKVRSSCRALYTPLGHPSTKGFYWRSEDVGTFEVSCKSGALLPLETRHD